MGELILVRHPPVAKSWQGRCYGQSDAGLSREGHFMLPNLVKQLSRFEPQLIIHSGLSRTRLVAETLAQHLGLEAISEPLWRERDFGAWEGVSWQRIWRETGSAMDGMMTDPAGFKPGETGETTAEMIRQTWAAMRQIPAAQNVVVISHGGPIAAARMLTDRLSFEDLPSLIIPTASHVRITGAAHQQVIETPCIRLCALDTRTQTCNGCLRTGTEIGRWSGMDQPAKQKLIETIRKRREIFA
jgi:broad specificity phosphatase PhoE